MAEETSETPRRDPAPATENPDRIQDRAYESNWAAQPAEETDGQLDPGAGPEGGVGTSGRSVPLTTIAIGFGLLFFTFLLDSWVPLALGLLLIVVGGIWSGLTERYVGTMHGVGTISEKQQRKRERARH